LDRCCPTIFGSERSPGIGSEFFRQVKRVHGVGRFCRGATCSRRQKSHRRRRRLTVAVRLACPGGPGPATTVAELARRPAAGSVSQAPPFLRRKQRGGMAGPKGESGWQAQASHNAQSLGKADAAASGGHSPRLPWRSEHRRIEGPRVLRRPESFPIPVCVLVHAATRLFCPKFSILNDKTVNNGKNS